MHGVRLPDPGRPLSIGWIGLAALLASSAALAWLSGPVLALSAGPRANGTVVAIQRTGRSGKPVVEFQAQNGARGRLVGAAASSPPAYSVGDRVGVYYDPNDLSRAVIDSFGELWLVPLLNVAVALGSFGAGVGGLAIGYARRRRREEVRTAGQRLAAVVTEVEEHRDGKRYRYLSTLAVGERSPPETLIADLGFRPRIGATATVFVDPSSGDHFIEAAG